MGTERERVFLVEGEPWRQAGDGEPIQQCYLAVNDCCEVRLRHRADAWTLTIKSRDDGAERIEVERALENSEAQELRSLCQDHLRKTRYECDVDGHTWEIDVFHDRLDGLVLAEVELAAGDEPALPDWAGSEVTGDHRYRNVELASADTPP